MLIGRHIRKMTMISPILKMAVRIVINRLKTIVLVRALGPLSYQSSTISDSILLDPNDLTVSGRSLC